MDIVIGILYAVDVVCALLLIGIVLIQQSKSGGGLGVMGGGMTDSVFGTAAGNVITKTTVILAAIFLVVTLALAITTGHRSAPKTLADQLRGTADAAPDELMLPETGDTSGEGVADPVSDDESLSVEPSTADDTGSVDIDVDAPPPPLAE